MEIYPHYGPNVKVKTSPYAIYPEQDSAKEETGGSAGKNSPDFSEPASASLARLSDWITDLFSRLGIDLAARGIGVEQVLKVLSKFSSNPLHSLAILSYFAEADPDGVADFFLSGKAENLDLDRLVVLWRNLEKDLNSFIADKQLPAELSRGLRILETALNRMRVKTVTAQKDQEFSTSGLKALMAGRDLTLKSIADLPENNPQYRLISTFLQEAMAKLTPEFCWALAERKAELWIPYLMINGQGENREKFSLLIEKREKENGILAKQTPAFRVRFSLQLERLGNIEGELNLEAEAIKVELSAANAYAQNLLNREVPEVKARLEKLGCPAEAITVGLAGEVISR